MTQQRQPVREARWEIPEPLRSMTMGFWLALALTFVANLMALPARFATAPLAIVSLVLGSIAVGWSAKHKEALALRWALIVGLVAAAGFAMFGALWLVFAPEVSDFERCADGAITPGAEQTCLVELEQSLYQRVGLPVPSAAP